MKYILVKVLMETEGTVYLDLLLSRSNSLEELYNAIMNGFDFDGDQMGSFLKEGDGWQAAAEYPLEALGENDKILMSQAKVKEVFKEVGDQLTLIYDYMNEWKFHLEVIEMVDSEEEEDTPKVLKTFGKPPKEADRKLSGADAESILMNAILGDEFDEEEEDDDYDDPFESGDYDSLDDYEEYQ